jgi:hypothetical protein
MCGAKIVAGSEKIKRLARFQPVDLTMAKYAKCMMELDTHGQELGRWEDEKKMQQAGMT